MSEPWVITSENERRPRGTVRGSVFMPVVGYVRVSTEDQAREGVSLATQQAKIEAYAVVKDWMLLEMIQDDVTAKHLKRPGVQRLLSLVEAGQVDVVIIYKLDRLTRSVADLDKLMKLFERKGVALGRVDELFYD